MDADWWEFERADGTGRENWGSRPAGLVLENRITASSAQLHAIARAIRERKYVEFKRCEVDARFDPVAIDNPKEAPYGPCYFSRTAALRLADQIEAVVPTGESIGW